MIRIGELLALVIGRTDEDKWEVARYLRANQTPSERMMARCLFHLGIQAEPQVPISGYIVDFLDAENRVVIEVDGGIHAEQKHADDLRTAVLERAGYRIIRIWNDEVIQLMQDIALSKYGVA